MAIKVGYLGPAESTNGYTAALKFIGDDLSTVDLSDYESHDAVCEAVGSKVIDYGIVAIENVMDGFIAETIHAVEKVSAKYMVNVCQEIAVPIEHLLLNSSGDFQKIEVVSSHQSALTQCNNLIANLEALGIKTEKANSTGDAAKKAMAQGQYAAIASRAAQSKYNLKCVVPVCDESSMDQAEIPSYVVSDRLDNETRFWVLGREMNERSGNDKTCFLINLAQDKIGVLHKVLGIFAAHNLNLLFIYPNPIRGRKWEYTFFLELKGHILDQNMSNAYNELATSGLCPATPHVLGSYGGSSGLKFLGSYVDAINSTAVAE